MVYLQVCISLIDSCYRSGISSAKPYAIIPEHIFHYSKSLLSSWLWSPLNFIIRVRNTLFCTTCYSHYENMIPPYNNENKSEHIRHSYFVRRKKCIQCNNTILSWKVLKLCKFSGEPVADISKSIARFLGYRFPDVSGFRLCFSLFLISFAFSIPPWNRNALLPHYLPYWNTL